MAKLYIVGISRHINNICWSGSKPHKGIHEICANLIVISCSYECAHNCCYLCRLLDSLCCAIEVGWSTDTDTASAHKVITWQTLSRQRRQRHWRNFSEWACIAFLFLSHLFISALVCLYFTARLLRDCLRHYTSMCLKIIIILIMIFICRVSFHFLEVSLSNCFILFTQMQAFFKVELAESSFRLYQRACLLDRSGFVWPGQPAQ